MVPKPGAMCTYANAIYILTLVWALIVIVTSIAKACEFGIEPFIEHYTNWNFLFAGLFYLLILPFNRPRRPGQCLDVRMSGCIVAWCFFPLYLNTWFVFAVVSLLLAEDPAFITDLFEALGANVVMLGDAFFHFVPLLGIVIFTAFFPNLIFYGVNRQCVSCNRSCGSAGVCLYATYLFIGGSLLFVALYCVVLVFIGKSPNSVYMTDISPGIGFLILFVLALTFNGSYLLVLDQYHRVRESSKHPRYDEARAMLKTDAELFGERRDAIAGMIDKQLDAVATSAMADVLPKDLDMIESLLDKAVEAPPPPVVQRRPLVLDL